MRKRFLVVTTAIIAVTLLSLIGYWILSSAAAAGDFDGTFPSVQNAEDIYASAIDAVNSADRMALNITKNTLTTAGAELFEENSLISYVYENPGSDTMRASATETVTIGSQAYKTTEFYIDGTAYITVNDSGFSSKMTADAFSARFIPSVCLEPSLYAQITGVDTGESYILSFSKPSAPEDWIADTISGFETAAGTAYISHDGKLLRSVYTISYKLSNATVNLSIMVEPVAAPTTIQSPADLESYVPITYLDGPKQLEKACGYLLLARNLSAVYTDETYFEAFGDKRVENINLYTSLAGAWSALVDTKRSITNTSREGEVSNSAEKQLFAGNIYCSAKDGGALIPDATIRLQDMQNYCNQRLLSTIMLPEYITQCTMTQDSKTITIRFNGNEDFAKLISSNACQILYQKPELLNEIAQSSTTKTLTCYLKIDKTSGLPLSAGIEFSGSFEVNQLPYVLSFKADQTYVIPDGTANDIITKAAG